MSRTLTKKQRGFVKDYLDTGNGVQSALKNYDTKDYSTAGVIAAENINKPKIIEYLESRAEKAAEKIVELSKQRVNLPVSLGATKDILDRAGFKPVERSETRNLNVEVKLENKDMEAVRKKYEQELKKLNANAITD